MLNIKNIKYLTYTAFLRIIIEIASHVFFSLFFPRILLSIGNKIEKLLPFKKLIKYSRTGMCYTETVN